MMQCISVPEIEASYSKDMGISFFFSFPSWCISVLYQNVSWSHKIFRECIKKKKKTLGIKGKSPHTTSVRWIQESRLYQRPRVKFISTNVLPCFDFPLNARTLNSKLLTILCKQMLNSKC